MGWVLYVALEPHVRRRWPESMISWSRVLTGGFRDSLVGEHQLIGVASGVGLAPLELVVRLLAVQDPTASAKVNSVVDTRRMIEVFVGNLTDSIAGAMFLFFVFFLLRGLLRRQWLAAVVAILLFAGLDTGDHPLINGPVLAVEIGLAILILIRFGILPLIVGFFVGSTLFVLPLTTDFSTWYAGSTPFVLASALVLTVVAFHMAIAGRALFKEGFLEAT